MIRVSCRPLCEFIILVAGRRGMGWVRRETVIDACEGGDVGEYRLYIRTGGRCEKGESFVKRRGGLCWVTPGAAVYVAKKQTSKNYNISLLITVSFSGFDRGKEDWRGEERRGEDDDKH
jgi:hypothetical protein